MADERRRFTELANECRKGACESAEFQVRGRCRQSESGEIKGNRSVNLGQLRANRIPIGNRAAESMDKNKVRTVTSSGLPMKVTG